MEQAEEEEETGGGAAICLLSVVPAGSTRFSLLQMEFDGSFWFKSFLSDSCCFISLHIHK